MPSVRSPRVLNVAVLLATTVMLAPSMAQAAVALSESGEISSAGASAFFSAGLLGGQRVVATLVCTDPKTLDPVLEVRDPDGNLIASDDNSFSAGSFPDGVDCITNASARVNFVTTVNGGYEFRVSGAASTVGFFRLTARTADDLVIGAGPGGLPRVRVFLSGSGAPLGGLLGDFFAYPVDFTGGVRVAAQDVTFDSVPDIVTGAGPGGGPHVRAFDGKIGIELASFFAYDPNFAGGVFVAASDVGGQSVIVTGPGPGVARPVRVLDAKTHFELRSFLPYGPDFTGGVSVAVGDVNGDGKADIITGAGPGGGPHVVVFDGLTGAVLQSFFAFDAGFTGGVFVAAGDVNGDGKADIIVGAGPGGAPHVVVFDGLTGGVLQSFFAFDPSFTGGVSVAASDINLDGKADILVGAGPGAGPHAVVFDGLTGGVLLSFFAFDPSFAGGIFVGH